MLFFIQCKITIRVPGISGPFEETITKLVNANDTRAAQEKFEGYTRQRYAHMQAGSFQFQYLVVADTI